MNNTHKVERRMAFDPAFGDTRPSATLVHSTFGDTDSVSIDDLVGTRLVMQAVVTHHDPDHNHTCQVCLADHVLYYWACLGADRLGEPTASGFFITDTRNCKAKAHVNGRKVRLIPFNLTGEVQRDSDGDVAFVVESGLLLTMADLLEAKWAIQATGLPATPMSAQEDARLADVLRIHMTALFSGQDTVNDDEKLDLGEFAADPTYVVVLPNIEQHITPLVESLEDGDLARYERGRLMLEADDPTEGQRAVVSVTEGAAFYAVNILSCLSDEWWTDVYRKLVEGALRNGSVRHTDNPTHATTDPHPQPARDEDGRPIDESPAPPVTSDNPLWDDLRSLL